MTREFQVRYRELHNAGTAAAVPVGPVLTLTAIYEAPDQAEAEMAAAGFLVVGITEVRPIVDWTKPYATREEAAARYGVEPVTLSGLKGNGKIPFVDLGKGRYPTRLLDKYFEKHMNRAGKALLKEMEEAA